MSTELTTLRLHLREPRRSDAGIVCAYFTRNATRFVASGQTAVNDFQAGERWIEWHRSQSELERGKAFLAFAGPALAAIVELHSISPGAGGDATIAYGVDERFEGQGVASEAVAAVIAFAFGRLGLQTLVAHYEAHNARSAALLRRAGFKIIDAFCEVLPNAEGLVTPQVLTVLHAPGKI